ncbi:hypothetical protein [Actinoplanes sp. N902-109]|uniref:hypothetical protein n=1 Tax=Actinoplanes sp. (strain N902-109) TaxID=649831 RepID=UPI000329352A|nr:hypothetical protein [Actinoplanes sp. N902-109]AGL16329.1 hypothetical protein L083_2819 [Actinoplanes sp. N902-109]
MGLLLATIAAVLIAPGSAHAAPYPVEPPASDVSDGTVSDGGTVTFSGRGFLPFETVSISVDYGGDDSAAAARQQAGGFVLAAYQLPARKATLTTKADAEGAFRIEVPLSQVGRATLVARGLTSGVTITQTVTVVDSSGGNGGGGDDIVVPSDNSAALPKTGPSGRPLLITLIAGLGALVLGGGLLLLTRRSARR